VNGCVYLGGMVMANRHSEVLVRGRKQTGTHVLRTVVDDMIDKRILKKLSVNVLRTCVTPAHLHDRETVELSQETSSL